MNCENCIRSYVDDYEIWCNMEGCHISDPTNTCESYRTRDPLKSNSDPPRSGIIGYYDLILLPSGGHIPTPIFKHEYGVSDESIAKIPDGLLRDETTFECPSCGRLGFYAGICGVCEHYLDQIDDEIDRINNSRINRKELEDDEIRKITRSGEWDKLEYMESIYCR